MGKLIVNIIPSSNHDLNTQDSVLRVHCIQWRCVTICYIAL